MKVVHVVQSYKPVVSGPSTLVEHLTRELSRLGHECQIITSTVDLPSSVALPEVDAAQTRVRRFKSSPWLSRYNWIPGVRQVLLGTEADIFHVHQWRSHIADTAVRTAKHRGIPVVLQAHGTARARNIASGGRGSLLSQVPYVAYDALFRGLVPKAADALLATTTQEAQDCIDYGCHPELVHVIPLGIDHSIFAKIRNRTYERRGPFRILLVGRLERSRNVELLLRALSLLHQRGVSFACRIVGPEVRLSTARAAGYINELKQVARDLGVGGMVDFRGLRLDDELLAEYAWGDVFVYTSFYENFGYTILEAAACGLPLLTTATGVAPDLVVDGRTGYLIAMRDPSELANRLSILEASEAKRAKLGQNAASMSASKFSMNLLVNRYLELYTSLIRE